MTLTSETINLHNELTKPLTGNVSTRTARSVERIGYATIGDIVKTPEADLMQLSAFGEKCLNECRRLAANLGLELGADISDYVEFDEKGLVISEYTFAEVKELKTQLADIRKELQQAKEDFHWACMRLIEENRGDYHMLDECIGDVFTEDALDWLAKSKAVEYLAWYDRDEAIKGFVNHIRTSAGLDPYYEIESQWKADGDCAAEVNYPEEVSAVE